jgi:hypothetical protein
VPQLSDASADTEALASRLETVAKQLKVFSEQSVQVAQRLHRVEKHTLDDKDKKDAATANANAAKRYEARAQVKNLNIRQQIAMQ